MPKSFPKIPVIIDTREQLPWEFDADTFTTQRGTIWGGDYTIAGLQDVIRIERKSLGDAVQTVIHEWGRFRKSLFKLAGMDFGCVVVEATPRDILERKYESDAEPNSVLGRLISIQIDHGVPVVFAGDRDAAMVYAARYLMQAVKKCGGVPNE